MLDPTVILIFFIGLVPGMFSSYWVLSSVRKYSRHRYQVAVERSLQRSPYPHSYLQAQDYHYVEGLGYIVGELTCQFNARSTYLRCAVNPSGPCTKCSHYESIQFADDRANRTTKLNP